MFFQRIYEESLAQASYMVACQQNGEAIVIDARCDIDVYLEIAKKHQFTVKYVTETHIHADFLCGSRELAAVTGAEMYLSEEGGADWQYQFPHHGLREGDKIRIGNLTLEVLHTPGHTPESISFILTDHATADKPVMLFTGDFVFVGDVGRPDLLEKAAGIAATAREGAGQLYTSLKRFTRLDDYILVWPGHGAGSACGKSLGSVLCSTVGYEKIRNWAFNFNNDKEGFINRLLEGQPEPPKYFSLMKRLNREDRPLLTEVPKYPRLSKETFLSAYNDGVKVVDTRDKAVFAKGFLSGSLNIQDNNSFSTWIGWLLNYQEPFILIADEAQMEMLTRSLMRIGMDNVYGYISDIDSLGITMERAKIITVPELQNDFADEDDFHVIDVRSQTEFNAGHIPGSVHLFLGTLADHLERLPTDRQIIVYCQAGDRSTIAYSLLKSRGFKNVKNYAAGMREWTMRNNPVAQ